MWYHLASALTTCTKFHIFLFKATLPTQKKQLAYSIPHKKCWLEDNFPFLKWSLFRWHSCIFAWGGRGIKCFQHCPATSHLNSSPIRHRVPKHGFHLLTRTPSNQRTFICKQRTTLILAMMLLAGNWGFLSCNFKAPTVEVPYLNIRWVAPLAVLGHVYAP